MGTAGVDVAFMITLMEQSYREEEEMRKEAEAERKKDETDKTVISGDAKKGAGLFKVCFEATPFALSLQNNTLADSLRTMPHHSRRTKQDRSQFAWSLWAKDWPSRWLFLHGRKQRQRHYLERRHIGEASPDVWTMRAEADITPV
jgi:hypothetical protein